MVYLECRWDLIFLCRESIATRCWGKMVDLRRISTDDSLVSNFGKEVEYTL